MGRPKGLRVGVFLWVSGRFEDFQGVFIGYSGVIGRSSGVSGCFQSGPRLSMYYTLQPIVASHVKCCLPSSIIFWRHLNCWTPSSFRKTRCSFLHTFWQLFYWTCSNLVEKVPNRQIKMSVHCFELEWKTKLSSVFGKMMTDAMLFFLFECLLNQYNFFIAYNQIKVIKHDVLHSMMFIYLFRSVRVHTLAKSHTYIKLVESRPGNYSWRKVSGCGARICVSKYNSRVHSPCSWETVSKARRTHPPDLPICPTLRRRGDIPHPLWTGSGPTRAFPNSGSFWRSDAELGYDPIRFLALYEGWIGSCKLLQVFSCLNWYLVDAAAELLEALCKLLALLSHCRREVHCGTND